MSSLKCPEHNTHLVLFPADNTQPTCIALWAGTINGKAKIMRVSLGASPILNVDIKERTVIHINGLPDKVQSPEEISSALASLKKATLPNNGIIDLKFPKT